MSELKNYWGNNGKYQDFVESLESRIPGHGYTSNVYVNIYLVMAHLYYDAYNNGGCNIQDNYEKEFYARVKPYLEDKVDITPFIYEDFVKMESMMDSAIAFIKDKNLEFPTYSFWCNHELKATSNLKPVGELAKKGYWFKLTFGELEEMNNYRNNWCSKYKDLSDEKYYQIDLWNFDENNVPESAGSVFCIAHKEINKQEATDFCREELEMAFEEVGNVYEITKDEILEYYDDENDVPVFDLFSCEEKSSQRNVFLDDVIKSCEEVSKDNELSSTGKESLDIADR